MVTTRAGTATACGPGCRCAETVTGPRACLDARDIGFCPARDRSGSTEEDGMASWWSRFSSWRCATPLAAIVVAVTASASPPGSAGPANASFPGAAGVIAFSGNRASQGAENYDIFSIKRDGSAVTRLTDDAALDLDPTWSDDGARVAFVSDRGSTGYDLYVMAADGSDEGPLLTAAGAQTDPSWFPAGQAIAYTNADNTGAWDIYTVSLTARGIGTPVRLTTDPADDADPAVSPDGKRIAFTSRRDGGEGIYVMLADQPEGPFNRPVRLTTDGRGGFHPDWSPDGGRIAFDTGRDVWTMKADGSRQTNLTRNSRRGDSHSPSWSPDGRQIAFIHHTSDSAPWNLYRMNRDGTHRVRLTDDAFVDDAPAWQPA
jgi:Tol biopolymer transport system component